MDEFLESLIPDMTSPIAATAQVIGWIGMVLIVISFQFKKIKYFYLTQAIGNLCFAVSFLLIGSYAGAGLNFLGSIRSTIYMWERNRKNMVIFWGVLAAMAGMSVLSAFTGDSWSAIIPMAAQICAMISMVYGSDKVIRIAQAVAVSPLWLAYNIVSPVLIHGESIQWGQVICECVNIISSIVFLVRIKNKSAAKRENNESE